MRSLTVDVATQICDTCNLEEKRGLLAVSKPTGFDTKDRAAHGCLAFVGYHRFASNPAVKPIGVIHQVRALFDHRK
jgi:hypothetical protein